MRGFRTTAAEVVVRCSRCLLALVLTTAVAWSGVIVAPPPPAYAADTAVTVSSAQVGAFTSEMLGSNVTPVGRLLAEQLVQLADRRHGDGPAQGRARREVVRGHGVLVSGARRVQLERRRGAG